MGLLFSKIWSLLFSSTEYKVVVIGLNNAGKTTTVYKLLLGEVVVTTPTIGSNVEEIQYKNLKFQMWDLGGQENLRKTWTTYYEGAHAIVLVIDSTDVDRIPLAREELDKLLAMESTKSSALLVYANKQDLKGALQPAEISDALGLSGIKDHDWTIQGCCALTGEGLYEGLDWVVAKIKASK